MADERVHIEADLNWVTNEHTHKLFDADGNTLGLLPKSFTDGEIRAAVRLANAWYAAGLEDGRQGALSNLRNALGIQPASTN